MSRFIPRVTLRSSEFTALAAAGALATMALLGSPAVATAAQPVAAAPQLRVYYSYRDLSTDQGTHALYQRIVSAARNVCPAYDARDLDTFAYSRACQRQAVAHAIRQIGSPRLAAVYVRAHGASG
ncbi:MAG TPA: UrcA family protein [Steroidobacteraceae bacterium]|nr:UrcA family protein [Steroidobacteraceae bacterium]